MATVQPEKSDVQWPVQGCALCSLALSSSELMLRNCKAKLKQRKRHPAHHRDPRPARVDGVPPALVSCARLQLRQTTAGCESFKVAMIKLRSFTDPLGSHRNHATKQHHSKGELMRSPVVCLLARHT